MAKFLRLNGCLAAFLLFIFTAYQSDAQSFTGKIEQYSSPTLSGQFSTYEVFQLDAKQLDAYVKSNAESPAQLKVGVHDWQLVLTLNHLVRSNYLLQVHSAQGVETSSPKRDIAFKGYEANGGGRVRLTINGEFLYGFIQEGEERYYIEPLWYFDPHMPRDLFVLYPQSAVAPFPHDICGVTEEQIELQRLEDAVNEKYENLSESSGCYELEIAIASDASMFNKYGSVGAVEDHNIGVINNVQGDFTGSFNHDLEFVIVTQFVSTGNDPWTNSNDAGTLLGSFRTWGNNGNFGVNFDVGELWTNRTFNGNTIGIAYLNGICNTNKYHCLRDFSGNAQLLRCLTSHELGHNFSSGHDANCPPPNLIMCPSVSTANTWSDQSSNAINNYMQGRINNGCLSACGPPPPPLVAGFAWDPNPGCQSLPVAFTDLSTGIITSWNWTFQGGSPASSTQQNPAVTWNTPGPKNVSLTINGVGGSNSATQVIDIVPLPVANFTFTVNGLEVSFTSTSTDATGFEWDFGDGLASFEQNPIHEYFEAGIYVVTLKVSNECGISTKTMIVNTAPTANFEASPLVGCTALVVVMENQSSSNAVTYTWSFPGGAPSASNLANPTVVYNIAGTYTITLTATNGSGSHTFTRTNYISVNATPVAKFTSTINLDTVTFSNTTIGTATYLWEFGDGDTSTVKNPVHVYPTGGTYVVVLTATNECGTSTKTDTISIASFGPPVAGFSADTMSGCAPLTVNFTNNSLGAVSYQWTFPGGSPDSSTVANPTVVYDSAGVYVATLIATNANGSDTSSMNITVNTGPTAGFTFVISNHTTVAFENTSTGANSYQWDFGDTNSSTEEDPTHTYATDGVYTVILTAANECDTVISTQTLTVVTPPTANFTATPTTGCDTLSVQFANTSGLNAVSFLWDFPGGTPSSSTEANPLVDYATPGIYSATLIAINAAGQDTFTRVDYIIVNGVPTAGFTSSVSGLTATFTNTSTGATSYSWDFGDSNGSTEANPEHTYATDGVYTVILSATNDCGTVTSTQTVTVVSAPTAGFTASTNIGCVPLTVEFTNTSSANATAFNWQFPGGEPSSSTEQNPPSVVYDVPGTYTVTLTASNSGGSSTHTQTIIVQPGPTANFTASTSLLEVTFTNTSSNSTSYHWDFGDSQESNEANPTHTYAADGTYTVVLTATNDCGTSTFTQNVVIITEPDAGFSASTTAGCAVLTVNFTDISEGDPVSWEWDFPGGTPSSSTEENPTVQYFTPGVYDVTLVVTSIGGSTSSFTQTNFITVNGAPTVGFNSDVNGLTVDFSNSSTGASSYMWAFGDGDVSPEEHPTHTYAQDGVYTVTLTATNSCGSSIYEQTLTIVTAPTASFTAENSGCTPFTVTFNNTSSSNATDFEWDFPGGNPSNSNEESPTVTWNTPGVYTVTLTASNSAGSSTSTTVITVGANPSAAFSYQQAGLTAIFTNTSANGDSYTWNFGDGSDESNEQNPSHTYSQTGTYTVTLTVTNECGTVTTTQTVEISGAAPAPAINSNKTEGCLPFSVQFTDQSAGDPTEWAWSFPGGTPSSSTEQNPAVSYSAPGVYDVTLEVTNIFGSESQTFPAYITVEAAPTAGFDFSVNQTTVTFTNNSQNADSYSWNFGDNNISPEANPTHTYGAPGTYTVSLSATNNCGTTIIEQTVTLSVGIGEASWVEGFRLFPNPNTGQFVVEMSGLPKDEVEFVLFNALGQLVKREFADFGTGVLLRSFDYGDLAAGVYTLRVQADGQAMFVKIVVGR
jgi:PKD repeat protein